MSLDKLVDSSALDASLTSVADAIRSKASKTGQLSFPNGFIREIREINNMTDETPIDDVTFVDFDGKVLYTYSAEDFLELSAMPSNPSYPGLTAQGWNWTLADAKTFVGTWGTLCIGQNYKTDDGSTRIYITVPSSSVDIAFGIEMYTTVKGGVNIDWGDGYSEDTTGNANTAKVYYHTYTTPGDYIVTLDCTDGKYSLGYNGANNSIFNHNVGYTMTSAQFVRRIEIGDDCTQLYRQAFRACNNLESISIPTSLTLFGSGTTGDVFNGCHRLSCIVLPNDSTLYGVNNFDNCFSIKFISYPKDKTLPSTYYESAGNRKSLRMFTLSGITTTGNYNFCYDCNKLERFVISGTYTNIYSGYCRESPRLRKIIIPSTVTSIGDYSMANTYVKELHVLATTPPTIVNTRGMPNFAVLSGVLYVPYSADHSILETYKTTTNWSTYAQYMQEEPQS